MSSGHTPTSNSFQSRSTFSVGKQNYEYYDLNKLPKEYNIQRLPFSLKILLENLLRKEDGISVTTKDILALINWSAEKPSDDEIAFTPSRVILQDFTGVPAVVDLAAMRAAMPKLKGNPKLINPLSPVELVIDHSVMVDYYGNAQSFQKNVQKEFSRNEERYVFLRWGQTAFENFRVVPPGTGIVHQVNLEYLASVVFTESAADGKLLAFPDTLVGTDSHTTMINGLGVLGWGVGGIEAEAAMLGQPITMLIPEVLGFKLVGSMKEGTTATDLVLTVVEMLRKKNVVGKFVEFYGEGLDNLPIADRATIANMAPEYGATCGIFPIDEETLTYLRLTGREESQVKMVEAYAKAQGFFRTKDQLEAEYSDQLFLDLSTVEPCIAGPKRPQDRISLSHAKVQIENHIKAQQLTPSSQNAEINGQHYPLDHGAVVIAAITSCTNTSNPDVMIAAGLLAKKALELGLMTKPWVKTSLAPGSQVVTDYYQKAGLIEPLDTLGFNLVGYGCTTCIGNSGPLLHNISRAILSGNLSVAAVLSGNRNFEGRIHPEVKNSFLASPPLVVAYALAGNVLIDFFKEAIGTNSQGKAIFLKDIWPSRLEIQQVMQKSIDGSMFTKRYKSVFTGDKEWQDLKIPQGELFQWDEQSTYIKNPPFFDNMEMTPSPIKDIINARVLALLPDSVTTDHISPAGDIAETSPAGIYLKSLGVHPEDFNSYGSRRGNHEVMMRGTFANIRLRNLLVPGSEGSATLYFPTGETLSIFDASLRYQKDQCPLIIIAGKEYGTGSSRDWAAKGTRLLGVSVVIAESFERIHRSNLIGMGVLPLEFINNENAKSLGLTGHESYTLSLGNLSHHVTITVEAKDEAGNKKEFMALVRIDTPKEMEYYRHGGILHYVLRQLAKRAA
jgi:aconitate hydratase